MKEWGKHLERAEEKLSSANLLFERVWQKRKQSAKKQIMTFYYEPSEEEAESVVEDTERFLERIKEAIKEVAKK